MDELGTLRAKLEAALDMHADLLEMHVEALAAIEVKNAALRKNMTWNIANNNFEYVGAPLDEENRKALALKPNQAALLQYEAGMLLGIVERLKIAVTQTPTLQSIAAEKLAEAAELERGGTIRLYGLPHDKMKEKNEGWPAKMEDK